MQTILTIAAQRIRVEMFPGLIRIVNDGALKRLIWIAPADNTLELVVRIRSEYQRWASKELMISDHSLIAEIWGHMLVERYALRMRLLINRPLTNRFIRFLLDRMAVIDCGEGRVDKNRFIWDWIAPGRKVIRWLLPSA